MPSLEEDLKAKITNWIQDLEQGNPMTRAQAQDLPWDLMGMKPVALERVARYGFYLADLAEIFHDKRDKLHPWVTVYGAALGMQSVWGQIFLRWVANPAPQGDPMHPRVQDAIDTYIPNYARMVGSND